jgi:hypothetical protein
VHAVQRLSALNDAVQRAERRCGLPARRRGPDFTAVRTVVSAQWCDAGGGPHLCGDRVEAGRRARRRPRVPVDLSALTRTSHIDSVASRLPAHAKVRSHLTMSASGAWKRRWMPPRRRRRGEVCMMWA